MSRRILFLFQERRRSLLMLSSRIQPPPLPCTAAFLESRTTTTMQQQRSSSSTVQQQQQVQQQPIIVSPNIVFQQSTVVRRGGGGGGKNTSESSSNTSSSNQPPPPPLILLFAWAIAKERHLEKFRTFWLGRGFDILTIRTPFWELAFPESAAPGNAQQVIRFLTSTSNFAQRRILAQGCSLGAYSVATFVDQLKKLQENNGGSKKNSREKDQSQQSHQSEAEKARQIESALAGIILDSPGVSKALHVGAAQVLVQRPLARRLLRRAIYAYYHSSRRHLWDRLQRIGAIQAANPLRVPLLVLYSRDDQVVSARLVDELIEDWKVISDKEGEKPFSVQAKCWPVSEHVTHLRNFPEEYGAEVDRFLAKLGI